MKRNPKKIDSQIDSHLGKLIKEAESGRSLFKGSGKETGKEPFKADARQTEAIRLSQLQCKYFNRETLRCDYYKYDYTPIECPYCPAKVLRDSKS